MISGKTEIIVSAVIIISAVASVTDLLWGRIYNWLTLPAIILGIVASAYAGGFYSAGESFAAVLIGFVIYGWMFWLRHMGAGDVKMLMALGAWGGIRFVLEVGLLGVLLGGVMAFFILLARGRLRDFLHRLYRFLLTIFVKELELQTPQVDRKQTMPYGLAIAAAAIWVAIADPFTKWGMQLWH